MSLENTSQLIFHMHFKSTFMFNRSQYLLLKAIHDISGMDLVEFSKYDMSFKDFLNMTSKEHIIDPSS